MIAYIFLALFTIAAVIFISKLPLSLGLISLLLRFLLFYLVACLWFPANGNVL